MVRSAAKNFQSVGVVTDSADYGVVAAELREKRELSMATRLMLARKAYARTARYDGEIATELVALLADLSGLSLKGVSSTTTSAPAVTSPCTECGAMGRVTSWITPPMA